MELFTIRRDDEKDLRFTGELIASAASSPDQAMGSSFEGTGVWREFALYRTEAGRYVGSKVNRTQWQGSRDEYQADYADTPEELYNFFGGDWLAKELYESAEIDIVEDIG